MQAIADHADLAGGPPMMQRVERMREHRVSTVRAGLLRAVGRRERQMMTCSASDDEERADPVQQSEINRRCRRHADNGNENRW